MDIKYVAALAKVYEELHTKLIEVVLELDWPVCTNPRERHEHFLQFLDQLDTTDEWAKYYKDISMAIEVLIYKRKPKDTTK